MTIAIRTRAGSTGASLGLSELSLDEGGLPLVLRGWAFILVARGAARARSQSLGRPLTAPGGILVPAGRGASIEAAGECALSILRWDEALVEAISAILPGEGQLDRLRGATTRETRCATVSHDDAESFRGASARLAALGRSAGDYGDSMRFLLAGELLLATARVMGEDSPLEESGPSGAASAEGGSPWSIDDAIRHIEAHYAEGFALEFFVSRCALNTSDFSRRFKEAAGCPLFEFINRQRIRRACVLLKNGDLPIIEIALAVGYNNPSFFNRYFLKIMGTTPREYRAGTRR
jgi:AraC-like DNA-binding protein